MVAFAFLPPEINSALIYGGAGSGPLFVAASAWDGLAADLEGSASSFQSVISTLADGPWSGPASAAMAGAAAPYVAWLAASAAAAEGAAAQARAAATAFEGAQIATVHPAAVTANRAQLVSLIATNILGQNTAAIAATEFEYVEMWAQDVAAMLGYHAGALSVASALPSLSIPPISLPGLVTSAQSLVATAGVYAGSALSAPLGLLATVSPVLTELSPVMQLVQYGMMPISYGMSPMMMIMSMMMQMGMQSGTGAGAGMAAGAAGAAAAMPVDAVKLAGDAVPKGMGLGGLGGAVSAGLGEGRLVGAMSVPSTWSGSMEAGMTSTAMAGMARAGLPSAALAAEEAAAMGGAAGTGTGTGMMPMPLPMGAGGAGGMGMPGGMMRGGAAAHLVQNRPSVVPRTGV